MNIVVIAGLALVLVACVSSDEPIRQQVAADHKTCLNDGEPGSAGYQNCREQLILARREEAAKSRGRGPERALSDRKECADLKKQKQLARRAPRNSVTQSQPAHQ